MAYLPDDIEAAVEDVRQTLLRWHADGTLGEVAVIVGQNQYLPVERPTHKHKPISREQGKPTVRIG